MKIKYFFALFCFFVVVCFGLGGLFVCFRSFLTILHSPVGGPESDKYCPSSDTPALQDPLQMEEKLLVASHNLEQEKKKALNLKAVIRHSCHTSPARSYL